MNVSRALAVPLAAAPATWPDMAIRARWRRRRSSRTRLRTVTSNAKVPSGVELDRAREPWRAPQRAPTTASVIRARPSAAVRMPTSVQLP